MRELSLKGICIEIINIELGKQFNYDLNAPFKVKIIINRKLL